MAANGLSPTYACRCLNVGIHPESKDDEAPFTDTEFHPVYIGEDGISISHVQATMRCRTSPFLEDNSGIPRSTRLVSLTCLICQTLVYQVKQVVYAASDAPEGPVLLGDDWAEQHVLKSATGWVEVSNRCLKANAVTQAQRFEAFSEVFSIVVPSGDPNWSFPTPSSVSAPSSTTQVPRGVLPPSPPLFAPPPFTPSHPVFQHFSELAIAELERARYAAEEYLAKIAQEKAAEVHAREVELKREVEVLWSRYKEGVEKLHQDASFASRPTSSMARRRSSGQKPGGNGHGPSDDLLVSVRVNDFVPDQSVTSRASSIPLSRQVTSALSTSLATSSFHHPEESSGVVRSENDSPRSPVATMSSPGRSSRTRAVSPSLASSRTMAVVEFDAEASIRDAYRRNMDESKDIATSYRYVLDLEAEMAEHQRDTMAQDGPSSSMGTVGTVSLSTAPRGRSPRSTKSSIKKGKQKENEQPSIPTCDQEAMVTSQSNTVSEEVTARSKRKVTFDVKPEVAIIDTVAIDVEKDEVAEETAIFDMEEEDDPEISASSSPTTLTNGNSPTIASSQPVSPARRSRPRPQDPYGLPPSLSSLRPSSLPNIRSIRLPARTSVRSVEPDRPRAKAVGRNARDATVMADRELTNGDKGEDGVVLSPDSREAQILSIVAASVPSHRSAWKKDSKAWQLFVERRGRRNKELGPLSIEEEEESDSTVQHDLPRLGRYTDESEGDADFFGIDRFGGGDRTLTERNAVTSSLPIPMMHHMPGASLQLKTSLTDRPGVMVPSLRMSASVAVRRQVYAERDRQRHIDPGAFELDDVADDEEVDDSPRPDLKVGSLAEKRALQILEAADSVPAEGMWRSLAA